MDDDDITQFQGDHPDITGDARQTRRWVYISISLLFLGLIGIAYWQRINVADRIVRDQLDEYGVLATYDIEQIGVRTQRLANIVVGDPDRPDFTADWMEIDISLNFSGANITNVRMGHARLRGRYLDDKVSFGELDKFSTGEPGPFEMPDWEMSLDRAQVQFETPWGVLGAALDGAGLLRHRFEGNLSVRGPAFAGENCRVDNVRFDGRYVIDKRQPGIIGPILADQIACAKSGLFVGAPQLDANMMLSETFDRWFGETRFSAKYVHSGELRLDMPRGQVDFDGKAARTNFTANLTQAQYAGSDFRIGKLAGDANGHIDGGGNGFSVAVRGNISGDMITLGPKYLSAIGDLRALAPQTPVGPILAKIGPALRQMARDFDGGVRYDMSYEGPDHFAVAVDGINVRARTGARLSQNGKAKIVAKNGNWRLASPIILALSGGALPSAQFTASQKGDGRFAGGLTIAPYVAGDARFAVPGFAFSGQMGGAWTFNGHAYVSGPLGGGRVDALKIPLNGGYNGRDFALYTVCQEFVVGHLEIAEMSLSDQSFQICPKKGQAILRGGVSPMQIAAIFPKLVLSGKLGENAMQMESATIEYDRQDGFHANEFRMAFGNDDAITYIDGAQISGNFGEYGLFGNIQNAGGKIVNVPIQMSGMNGIWHYADGILSVDGALRIADTATADRFSTLSVPDLQLSMENSVITAIGTLHEPKTGRSVADIDIRHQFSDNSGRALLSVEKLTFDPVLQPEMITPLTLGVIANVGGSVSGDGQIFWDKDGVRSNGRFGTKDINLAAAFGPVEGLSTELTFTDLLGFETGPGQLAQMVSVNPGVEARNGRISYQLLSGDQVKIEGGRWPFAGGELILDPTILDFDISRPRVLTFRVIGMDAEKFLSAYEFENLRVSGIFDGTLPMVFDQQGGRIVGGSLKSRDGGGELSYIGELSYEDMGKLANFAFNALKSIRYRDLEINVDGNIGGEIITKVSFAGVQQGSLAQRNFITRQLARVPVQFNVSITAQFLQLISSIRGLYDSNYISQGGLPDLVTSRVDATARAGEEQDAATQNEPQDE